MSALKPHGSFFARGVWFLRSCEHGSTSVRPACFAVDLLKPLGGRDYSAYVPNQSLLGFTGVSADQGVSNRYTWSRKLAF